MQDAQQRRHEYLTVEHILLSSPRSESAQMLKACGAKLSELEKHSTNILMKRWKYCPKKMIASLSKHLHLVASSLVPPHMYYTATKKYNRPQYFIELRIWKTLMSIFSKTRNRASRLNYGFLMDVPTIQQRTSKYADEEDFGEKRI